MGRWSNSERRRSGALRDFAAERDGRTECRDPRRSADCVSDRHPSRRRRRGERRRSDGRRRQYRGAAGRNRQARRDLPVRGCLSAGERAARSRGHRSRANGAEKHRRTGARLRTWGRRER